MIASVTLIGNPPEVIELLNPPSSENGLRNPAPERRRPSLECPGRRKQNADRCRWKLDKKNYIILALTSLLLISVTCNVVQYVNSPKQQQAVPTSGPPVIASYPHGWIRNGTLCYIFSDTETTWPMARDNCSSSGGSLLVMATPQEMEFINKKKHPAEYWIGLRRETEDQPWKLLNGSDFNNWFPIKGEGLCASLNDGVVSSTNCDNSRRWICYRDLSSA